MFSNRGLGLNSVTNWPIQNIDPYLLGLENNQGNNSPQLYPSTFSISTEPLIHSPQPTALDKSMSDDYFSLYLLNYSRRFHICNTVTTPEVRIRRVFVWRLLETMEGEAMVCLGKWLGIPEMFWQCSEIVLRCVWCLDLKLVGRWNNQKS